MPVSSRSPLGPARLRTLLFCLLPNLGFGTLAACTLTADDFSPTRLSEAEPATSSCTSGNCPSGLGSSGPGNAPLSPRPAGGDGVADPNQYGEEPLPGLPSEGPRTPIGTGTDAGLASADGAVAPGAEPSQPDGWASVAGLGVDGTTGGGSAALLTARTAAELAELAARPEPLQIGISGSIELPLLELSSNKTLIGLGDTATLRGGIRVRGSADQFVTNVIIRNLHVDAATSQADGDGVQLHYAHHVWIDHCEIRDAADGLVDVVHGSDFVTLSWNRFVYTAAAPVPEHRFANLMGHSVNNATEDALHLNVTFHHNHWSDGVTEAVFSRFGDVHFFDNYFASPGNQQVIVAGLSSRLLVENNYFESVAAPHALFPNSSAQLVATSNVYVETTGARDVTATSFVPVYAYDLEPALSVPAAVVAGAGPH